MIKFKIKNGIFKIIQMDNLDELLVFIEEMNLNLHYQTQLNKATISPGETK